jgi:integrase
MKEKKRRTRGEGAVFFRPKSVTIPRTDASGEEICSFLESVYRSEIDDDRITAFSLRIVDGVCCITPRTESKKTLHEMRTDDPRFAGSAIPKIVAPLAPKAGVGLWVAEVDLGKSDDDKRIRRTIYGQSKGEVQRKVTDLRVKHGGTIRARAPGTVGGYLENWLKHDVLPNRRASTYTLYEQFTRLHVLPYIGSTKLDAFGVAGVDRLYAALREKEASSSTLDHVARMLHTAFEVARKKRLIPSNPFDEVSKPTYQPRERPLPTMEEILNLLEVLPSDRLEAFYLLLIKAGLRVGEALGLFWEDLNLDGRTLTVRAQLTELAGVVDRTHPKTKKSLRIIDLGDDPVAALRRRQEAWKEEGHGVDYVFTTPIGTPLRRSNIRKRSLNPLLTKAKIRTHITLKDFRAIHASLLAAAGVSVKTAQDRLGHANATTTLNHYMRTMAGLQREAADKVDALLNPKRKKIDPLP